jgi:hypothetical protein
MAAFVFLGANGLRLARWWGAAAWHVGLREEKRPIGRLLFSKVRKNGGALPGGIFAGAHLFSALGGFFAAANALGLKDIQG